MVLTIEERVFLVKHVFLNRGRYSNAVIQQFKMAFPDTQVPHPSTVRNLINKFRRTGSVHDVSRPGRPSVSEETSLNIQDIKLMSPGISVRKLAQKVHTSSSTVYKVLKKKLELHVTSESEGNNKSSLKKTKQGSAGSLVKTATKAPPSETYSHWLVKSEPGSRYEKGMDMKFSFDDLKASPDQIASWDGVRNYQARNFLRDQMKLDHLAFFYHSNCKDPGIVGICQVVRESYPDHTQFNSQDPHFDSSSKEDNPKWFMVDVKYVRPLKRFISLAELKKIHQEHVKSGGPLQNMAMFTRARLSVQPLTQEEWDFIIHLEDKDT